MKNILKVIRKNNILKNFSVLTGTNLIIQVLSVLSSIRLARLLQPEGYGRLNYVLVQASLFGIIASFGVRLVVIRTIARNKNSTLEIFKASNKVRLIATTIAILCVAIYNLYIVNPSVSAFLLFSIIALLVFNNAWDALESVAFGFEKMEASGAINLGFMVLYLITIYVIPPGYFTVNTMVTVLVSQQVLKTLTYYVWLKRKILVNVKRDFEHITVSLVLNQSTYYFILAIFTAVQNQLPVLFLKTNASYGQIGLFNIGYRILMPLQMVLDVLLTALFPRFSMLAVTDKAKFAKNIKLLLNVLVFTGIICCTGFTLFSKNVVLTLYGNKYNTSISVIIIQCWFNVLYSIFCVIGTVLSSLDKQRQLALLSAIHALISIPIFLFGSRYGAIGLSYAFVAAAILSMTYHWVILKKLLVNEITWKYTFTLFFILFSVMAASILFPTTYPLWIKIVLFIVLLGTASLIFKKIFSVPLKQILKTAK